MYIDGACFVLSGDIKERAVKILHIYGTAYIDLGRLRHEIGLHLSTSA